MLRRLLALLVALAPPILLGVGAYRAVVRRLDSHLARATPIVLSETSRYLDRPVSASAIRVGNAPLSVARLREMIRHPLSFSQLPIEIDDLALGLRTGERQLAEFLPEPPERLGRIRRVRVYVSVPALLSGRASQEGLGRVELVGPEVLVVRNADGKFPLQDFLPTSGPPDYAKPPFRTFVTVIEGRVRFLDRAAKNGESLADNTVEGIEGFLDLTGARLARFRISGRAGAGTATASRLQGGVFANGTIARGPSGARPDSPTPESPRYVVGLTGRGADAAYWMPYFLAQDALKLQAGRADVRLSLIGPHQEPGAKAPPPLVRAEAEVFGGAFSLKAVPKLSVTQVEGTLRFDDGTLALDARALALGSSIRAVGTMENLAAGIEPPPIPQVHLSLDAPSVALSEILTIFKLPLPVGVVAPPTLSLTSVAVNGALTRPTLSGTVAMPRVGHKDYPMVRDVRAQFAFQDGVLRLEEIAGAISEGGTVSGKALWRFAAPDATGTKLVPLANERRRLWMEAKLENVRLSSLKELNSLEKNLRPTGTLTAQILGTVVGATPNVTANVRAGGLAVGGVEIPEATARVTLDGSAVRLEIGRVASPKWGAVTFSGALDGKTVGLEARTVGLDAGRVALLFGTPGIEALVSGRASLVGTLAAPEVRLRDVVGLNIRVRNQGRTFAVDGARCALATLAFSKTTHGYQGQLRFDEPLRLQRFPASATVTGSVQELLAQGNSKADPKLALAVRARRLDLEEVMRQITAGPPPELSIAATAEDSKAQITGTLRDPTVEGEVQIGELAVGDYPIESGRVVFRLVGGELFARKVTLLASIGELEGGFRLSRAGKLTGRFEAPELNLAALSYLTESVASLAGKAAAEFNLSGTKELPTVTASLKPGSFAEVAGTHLTELSGTARATFDLKTKRPDGDPVPIVLSSPFLSFRQAGATVEIRNSQFETSKKRFAGAVKVTEGQLETVLTALRSSRLDETEVGQQLIDGLNQMPAPLDGRFTLGVALAGRATDDGPRELAGDATLLATAVTIGTASVKSIEASARISDRTITLDKLLLTRDEAVVELPKPGKIVLPAKKGDATAFDLTLDSPETNLDLVRAFLPKFNLLGKVALTVQFQGTSLAPEVTASLEGQNLAVALADEREFTLSRLAFILRSQLDATGKGTLELSSGRVEHLTLDPADKTKSLREDAVSFDATLPLETVTLKDSTGKPYDVLRLASDAGLSVKTSIDRLGLDAVSEFLGSRDVRASGALTGGVSVGGTLAKPLLGGKVVLDAGEIRLPRDASGAETVNPISSAKLALTLDGSTIRLSEGTLSLAPPSKKQAKESFGRVVLTGDIRVDNLSELPAVLASDRPADAASRLLGEYDLTAKFLGFRPVERNLSALVLQAEAPLGLGEAVTGKLDGTLRITGKKLLAPHVSTPDGESLALTRAFVLLPIREAPPIVAGGKPPLFNPTFDIDLSVPSDATMANQSRLFFFGFSAQGDVNIRGDAFAPLIVADLTPTGGRIRYPLAAPFKVKKQGRIQLTYGSRTPRLNLSDVQAEGTLSVKPGSLSLAGGRIKDSGSLLAVLGTGSSLETAQRYKITLTFDGPLDLFGTGSTSISDAGGNILGARGLTTSSDPPLPGGTEQVLRLLGADDQIRRLASGDTQGAILSTLEQVSSNVFISGLLDPVNRFFVDSLGFSDFDINYFADGTAIVQASVAFKSPLDRFSANVTRTVQTRNTQTQRVPTLLSLTYELYRFASKDQQGKRRYLPRIQLGVSNEAQRSVRYFLRGTVNF